MRFCTDALNAGTIQFGQIHDTDGEIATDLQSVESRGGFTT